MYRWLFRRVQDTRAHQVTLAQFNVSEARNDFSRLTDRVIDGEEIVIARAGRPVAKLVPYMRVELTRPGVIRARITIDDRDPD
jgi:prevent-host-death family protein